MHATGRGYIAKTSYIWAPIDNTQLLTIASGTTQSTGWATVGALPPSTYMWETQLSGTGLALPLPPGGVWPR